MLQRYLPRHVIVASLALVLAIISIFHAAKTVEAYTVYYQNIKWYTGNPSYKITSAYTNYSSGWTQPALDIIAQWNSKSQPYGWFFWWRYDNSSSNTIDAAVITNTYCQGNACLGFTPLNLNAYSQITRSQAIVNIGPGYGFWDGVTPSYFPSNWYDLRTLLRHEVGHAYGLCHALVNGPVMQFGLNTYQILQIGTDDVDGIKWLYYSQSGPPPAGYCNWQGGSS